MLVPDVKCREMLLIIFMHFVKSERKVNSSCPFVLLSDPLRYAVRITRDYVTVVSGLVGPLFLTGYSAVLCVKKFTVPVIFVL